MRKRVFILAAILIIGAIVGYRLYRNYKHSNYKSYQCSLIGDFDKNGDTELLTVKRSYGKGRRHFFELKDLKTQQVIWEKEFLIKSNSSGTGIYELYLCDTLLLYKDSYLIFDSVNNLTKEYVDLNCLSSKTGDVLWEKNIFTAADSIGFYSEVYENQGDIYLYHSKNRRKNDFALLKLNPLDGSTLWEIPLPKEISYKPKFWGKNKLLIPNKQLIDKEGKILIINADKGDTNAIIIKQFVNDLFVTDDESFYFSTFTDIFRYDTMEHHLKTYYKRGIGEPNIVFDRFAMYDGRLICFNTFQYENDSTREIRAIPFQNDKKDYTYAFDSDYYVSTSFYGDETRLKRFSKNYNVFNTRYIPLQLLMIESTPETMTNQAKREHTKLIIFDLEEGKSIWESKNVNWMYLNNYQADSDYHYFSYKIPYKDTTEKLRITFNGKTGKFHKAIYFKEIPEGYIPIHKEEKFTGEQIYVSNERITWCLSFPELKLKYATGDIETQDAKAILEETLGEMPWTENN